jgi:hypothetical protein
VYHQISKFNLLDPFPLHDSYLNSSNHNHVTVSESSSPISSRSSPIVENELRNPSKQEPKKPQIIFIRPSPPSQVTKQLQPSLTQSQPQTQVNIEQKSLQQQQQYILQQKHQPQQPQQPQQPPQPPQLPQQSQPQPPLPQQQPQQPQQHQTNAQNFFSSSKPTFIQNQAFSQPSQFTSSLQQNQQEVNFQTGGLNSYEMSSLQQNPFQNQSLYQSVQSTLPEQNNHVSFQKFAQTDYLSFNTSSEQQKDSEVTQSKAESIFGSSEFNVTFEKSSQLSEASTNPLETALQSLQFEAEKLLQEADFKI